jgi:hypothetical protein
MCSNDNTTLAMHDRQANGQPDRGYLWDSNAASDIADAILGNQIPVGKDIEIGDSTVNNCDFCLVPGTKQAEVRAIQQRVNTDSDSSSQWYSDYFNNGDGTGNQQRLVVVPISTAACGTLPTGEGVQCPQITLPDGTTTTATSNMVVGFAEFFLLPSNRYDTNATFPICAEYVGPWVPGGTGGAPPGAVNAYTVGLVQ